MVRLVLALVAVAVIATGSWFFAPQQVEAAPTADEGSQLYINNGRMKVDNGRIISD